MSAYDPNKHDHTHAAMLAYSCNAGGTRSKMPGFGAYHGIQVQFGSMRVKMCVKMCAGASRSELTDFIASSQLYFCSPRGSPLNSYANAMPNRGLGCDSG